MDRDNADFGTQNAEGISNLRFESAAGHGDTDRDTLVLVPWGICDILPGPNKSASIFF